MQQRKCHVGLFCGGKSAEHDISLMSAANVVNALSRDRYQISIIGISQAGCWYLQDLPEESPSKLSLQTDDSRRLGLISTPQGHQWAFADNKQSLQPLDVAFPLIHGTYGEDGTLQGYLRFMNIPFVGCDVLGTAICMDKIQMKRLLSQAGIANAPFVTCVSHDFQRDDCRDIINQIGLPCYVKPANMGSSIGVSRVSKINELEPAILDAFRFDHKVVIEAEIRGREIECAVLGNEDPIASLPGEIIPQDKFYSYQAKYFDKQGAMLVAPADLSHLEVSAVQALALKTFKLLDCEGMARVDCFLTPSGKLYINEVNTVPGFTSISMYPKLWALSGIEYPALLDKLIDLALASYDRRQSLSVIP